MVILCHFCTKNCHNLGILRSFFVKKWHAIANFQKNLLNFAPLYCVVIWCKFQLIRTKIQKLHQQKCRVIKILTLAPAPYQSAHHHPLNIHLPSWWLRHAKNLCLSKRSYLRDESLLTLIWGWGQGRNFNYPALLLV